MEKFDKKSGGCQCGNIRYEIGSTPRMLYVCHCRDCQKQSSSAFGMSLIVDPAVVDFVKGGENLKTWDSRGEDGQIKRCAFCPECGTRIFHAADREDQPISIKAGSLDDTGWLQPVAHIWLHSKQAWVTADPARYRCFEREPEGEAELARLWQHQIDSAG